MSIIYNLFIGPLELFFEVVFTLAFRLVHNQGLSIVCLSLAMNFLVLPLYRQADKMQAHERDIELKLQKEVKHIKKTFKGDEQYMMLQTYYRQNNYKPTDALKGSVSLLLEIPFFIAAYRFLSSLTVLDGISMGPIKDLGSPDALLTIAGITINVLPVFMTLINFISSAIYLKGFPLKSKIQLYGIAIIFLVFLYKSPAGLVFYWTLNNLFSLCKNIVYKIVEYLNKKPKKEKQNKVEAPEKKADKAFFYLSCLSLALLTGLLIPSAVISSSPSEFINIATLNNPLDYLLYSLSLSLGLFIVWFSVFYMLAGSKGKTLMANIMWTISLIFLSNYMFFGKNLGTLSSTLIFEETLLFETKQILINLAVILAIILLCFFISKKKSEIAKFSSLVLCLVLLLMSGMNILDSNKVIKPSLEQLKIASDKVATLPLSKTEKNVVVIMLDRATSAYIPYILNEDKNLETQFSGFTYYPNTAAFGAHTIFAAPAIWGGYEYTPEEMNKRDTESLSSKYDESLLVMPTLFSKEGYNVSVCDPSLAGYQWIPDLSIYDGLENTNAYITIGNNNVGNLKIYLQIEEELNRNFFCYSIFKTAPLLLQDLLYNDGLYNAANEANINSDEKIDIEKITTVPVEDAAVESEDGEVGAAAQVLDGLTKANGTNSQYLDNLGVLENLSDMTKITEKGGFILLTNELTHRPTLLQEPGYTYSDSVDNSTIYPNGKIIKTDAQGNKITLSTARQVTNYDVNMAALKLLGSWFDYLKENNLYDNTKIIIVSDHGWSLEQYKDRIIGGKTRGDDVSNSKDTMYYNALLMVKDYNKTGFETDNTFMTNADVPAMAAKGTLSTTKNPFTNKDLTDCDKSEVHIFTSHKWELEENMENNTYEDSNYYSVHDNMFDLNNWKKTTISHN